MLISVLLITLIALGGMMLTYLVAKDDRFMWRLAAGNIVGSAVFGLTAFVAACLFGFGPATILFPLGITLLPLLLLQKKDFRNNFRQDWAKAKGRLQGGGGKRIASLLYYAFFVLLFWLFFDQAMYIRPDGIYTGGSNNLGDLPFHLGAIFSFTDGNNFPPQNPSWAGARFSYPFIADFLTACFVKLGVSVQDAMFWQNFSWALSLLVILERFVAKVTDSKLAGRIAPALLFFSGGLGFVWFFKDYWESGQSIVNFIWHLPKDYTIGDHFRWGNSMVVLFITQRSLLLGMPLAVLVLGWLWKVFATENPEKDEVATSLLHSSTPLLLGILAGMLPLIHLHSLAALFVVTGFLFLVQPAKWKTWIMFGVGVTIVAIPELLWSMSGSASETTKFFEWHFGWDKRDDNVLWFWVKNTGMVIPAVIAGIWVYLSQSRKDENGDEKKPKTQHLLLFYLPFIALFMISNAAKLAPWEWDNIKVLIYWFIGSIPLIALAIAWAWEQAGLAKVVAAACFVVLTLGGALDVWRTASGQIKTRVLDREAMQLAAGIKQKTEPSALFLNAPTYNSAVVLSGRRSLMRYSGHLSSHGIDYLPREDDVKRIYEGGGVAEILMRKYNIEYVLISPEERNSMNANEEFFRKYPVIAEAGQYRVYKVKN